VGGRSPSAGWVGGASDQILTKEVTRRLRLDGGREVVPTTLKCP